ncbi:MAG: hypothetical protein BXU00_01500 [Candidatus Nanoclepta minutus]|uniref:Uncharacterized protein n=1 Tax=Candidatus Nanoclepta minutus TaxID=1940235 RepID=A0A397WMW0_9ARCH|nr:MAG: hypothetical protein BXU00_01500 [Candidatus Nanoclepta minutus]
MEVNKKEIIDIALIISIIIVGMLPLFFYQGFMEASLKKECLKATINAIKIEINRHLEWLETSDVENRGEILNRLNQLIVDLEKYKDMKIEEYTIPEKREVIGWIEGSYKMDNLLYIENMTRSGPFYHIVGIRGNATIEPNKKYLMTIYLVYPRYYPFESYYVYVYKY